VGWSRRRGIALGGLLTLVAGSALGWLWVRDCARIESVAAVGRPFPSLALSDLSGQPVGFDRYRGKRVLAAFLQVGCGHCQHQLAVLERIRQGQAGEGFALVAVSGDGTAETAAFFERHPVSYPVWVDSRGGLYKKLGRFTVPALFLLDENGILRRAADGYRSFQEVRGMIGQFPGDGSSAQDGARFSEPSRRTP
jgi:peroxiredoxin